MVEKLEDKSFKRLTAKFPVPMLKYMKVNYTMVKPYSTQVELNGNAREFLDSVIQIFENGLFDLEFHSTYLKNNHLGKYGKYKINLRMESGKYVYQSILCTADPKKSDRKFVINESEEIDFDIMFTLEDDADEKIKILEECILNNKKITNTSIEIIYLTVALYMESKLTKFELLLKIATLTNQVEGLTEEELYEIKLFQKAFMKKFISDDDKLKGEIDSMISISDREIMREIFPEELKEEQEIAKEIGMERGKEIGMERGKEIGMERGKEIGMEIGKNDRSIEIARNMKGKLDYDSISKFTGLSIEQIEEL